jgi:hypothetical protein
VKRDGRPKLVLGQQYRHVLLEQRRQIALDTAKGPSADRGAEPAGSLLLHLDHMDLQDTKLLLLRDDLLLQRGYLLLQQADSLSQLDQLFL